MLTNTPEKAYGCGVTGIRKTHPPADPGLLLETGQQDNVHTINNKQNGRHIGNNVFKNIFFNDSYCIMAQISLKLVSKSPFDSKAALTQFMVWCQTSNKPLPELMTTKITTNQCHDSSASRMAMINA